MANVAQIHPGNNSEEGASAPLSEQEIAEYVPDMSGQLVTLCAPPEMRGLRACLALAAEEAGRLAAGAGTS